LSPTIHGARMGVYITIEFRCFVDADLAAATSILYLCMIVGYKSTGFRAGLVVILKKRFD